MFQGTLSSKRADNITAFTIIMAYIRSIVVSAFMIVLAISSIPIGIIVSKCCIGKPRKTVTLEDQDRTYVSIGAIVGTTFAVYVCIVTGIRGSMNLTTSIRSVDNAVDVIPSHVNRTLNRVPTVINDAIGNLATDVNKTIDTGVFMNIDVPTLVSALGTSDSSGPANSLLGGLQVLAYLVTNFTANTTLVTYYASNVSSSADSFNRDLVYLQRNITLLNNAFTSPVNRNIQFELKIDIPTIASTSTITIIASNLNAAVSTAIGPTNANLQSLPNYPSLLATATPVMNDLNGTILSLIQNTTASPKADISSKILVSGQRAQTQAGNVTDDISAKVDDFRINLARYFDDGKGGGILYYNGIRGIVTPLLLASAGLFVTLIVLATIIKVPMIVSVSLPNITMLSFLLLVIGSLFFLTAVILSDGCYLVFQDKSSFISSVANFNATSLQNFFTERDQCISDPTRSLITFAKRIGVNTDGLNITVAAAPSIESLDLSSIPNINFANVIPTTVSAIQAQNIPDLFAKLNSTLRLDLFAPIGNNNLTNIQQSIRNLKTALAPFTGTPDTYASLLNSTPNGTVLGANDVQDFDRLVKNAIALQTSLERNINLITDSLAKTLDVVNGMSAGIAVGQADYTIKATTHADDLLVAEDVYRPEWPTAHHNFGSADTVTDGLATPRRQFDQGSRDGVPPSPVLSSMTAARGRPIRTRVLPPDEDEILVTDVSGGEREEEDEKERRTRKPSYGNYFV
ncbi:hypothetical protein HDU97_000851 [Phlyctochytrium planicorne]|nr:hypothetical protein HDU97_000851 [Phlyctochytrium planicorne]